MAAIAVAALREQSEVLEKFLSGELTLGGADIEVFVKSAIFLHTQVAALWHAFLHDELGKGLRAAAAREFAEDAVSLFETWLDLAESVNRSAARLGAECIPPRLLEQAQAGRQHALEIVQLTRLPRPNIDPASLSGTYVPASEVLKRHGRRDDV